MKPTARCREQGVNPFVIAIIQTQAYLEDLFNMNISLPSYKHVRLHAFRIKIGSSVAGNKGEVHFEGLEIEKLRLN